MLTFRCIRFTGLFLFLLATGSALFAQQEATPPPDSSTSSKRLTIEVTGGDKNSPVENASVYLKTEEDHLLKDKKTEESVKTNMQGIAHIPDPPTGRVLIQIVANGWKPYGRWYDITDPKQVVKIHLDRPPKWY
jgi:hypothetical protein